MLIIWQARVIHEPSFNEPLSLLFTYHDSIQTQMERFEYNTNTLHNKDKDYGWLNHSTTLTPTFIYKYMIKAHYSDIFFIISNL